MLRRLTALHRWLGLLIGVQILAWSAGGLYFSWNDIRDVRGETSRSGASPSISLEGLRLPAGSEAVRSLRLILRNGRPAWEVGSSPTTLEYRDAVTGETLGLLSESDARAVVEADYAGVPSITALELLESDPPTEYREKPLPAWRATTDDAVNTRIYVDARSGAVTAYRNDLWRRFDFLWMLHTMDYWGRDDFHTPWLFVFAVGALLTASTGLGLWLSRLVVRVRKKRSTRVVAGS